MKICIVSNVYYSMYKLFYGHILLFILYKYLCLYDHSLTLSCLTLCDLMDYSLWVSSAHGIFQVKILGGLPFHSPAWQRMRWLDIISDSMDMNLSKFQNIVEDRGVWGAADHRVAKSQVWLSNLKTTNTYE